jgi:hypothetical protein
MACEDSGRHLQWPKVADAVIEAQFRRWKKCPVVKVRKTICFSKSIQMHDLVIGLFINRFAYGRAV